MTKRPFLLAALATLAATGASAQTSPWYVGVAQAITRDSNVLRVADGVAATGSTVSTTTLLGGLDQPIGRQRVFGTASVQHNRYSGVDGLDNTGYALRGGLDWSTAERVSGALSANLNRSLYRGTPGDAPATAGANIENSRVLDGVVRVGVTTPLTLEAGLNHRTLDYSAAAYATREFSQDTARVAARYRLGGALTLGVGLRHGRGDYPGLADTFKRNDLDFTASWQASGASTLNARLSASRARHTAATYLDLDGLTGALNWVWKPTGKMTVNTDLVRDDGSNALLYLTAPNNTLLVNQGDYSRVTNRLATRLAYQATAKITVNAGLGLAERSLRQQTGVTVNDSDRTLQASLGVQWAPIRALLLGCDASHEKRSGGGTLSQPYGVNTVGCSAQFVLQ